MVKIKIILTLGLVIAIVPFTGLPGVWQDKGYMVFGLAVALLAFLVLHESKNKMREENGDKSSGVFVENAPIENTQSQNDQNSAGSL